MASFNLLNISLFLIVGTSFYAIIVSPKGTFKAFFRITPELKNQKLWLFSVLAMIASKAILALFFESTSYSETKDIDDFMVLGTGWIIGITIVGSLVVPIVEEVFFRGYVLLPFLRNQHKHGRIAGLVFSSILFALAHESGVLTHLFSGLIYANLRIRQKTLLGAIILHSLSNLILLATMGIIISIFPEQ